MSTDTELAAKWGYLYADSRTLPELTEDQWERARVKLRLDAAPHEKDTPLYEMEKDCPHHELGSPAHVVGEADELHVPGGEDGEYLICLASPTGERVCVCGGEHCEQRSRIENEAEEFWDSIEEWGRRYLAVVSPREGEKR